jgi:hypothetical protein
VKCNEVLQCSDGLSVLFYCFVYGRMFCILLFNSVSYVFVLLFLCVLFVCKCVLPPGDNPIAVNIYIYHIIDTHAPFCMLFANWHSPATLTEVFPCFFLSCKANARVYLAKTWHGPHSF